MEKGPFPQSLTYIFPDSFSVIEDYDVQESSPHSLNEEEVKELTRIKISVSHMLENIFLITLDNGKYVCSYFLTLFY